MKVPIDHCPHCGSKNGFFEKQYARGRINYIYNFDGTEAENHDMYDLLTFTEGKYAYCMHCGKRLFKITTE